jgi:hypothetical protein
MYLMSLVWGGLVSSENHLLDLTCRISTLVSEPRQPPVGEAYAGKSRLQSDFLSFIRSRNTGVGGSNTRSQKSCGQFMQVGSRDPYRVDR